MLLGAARALKFRGFDIMTIADRLLDSFGTIEQPAIVPRRFETVING